MRKLVAVIFAFTLTLFVAASALTSASSMEEEEVMNQKEPVQTGVDLNSTVYQWMHQWMGDGNTSTPMDYNYSYANSWNQDGSCDTRSDCCNNTLFAQDN